MKKRILIPVAIFALMLAGCSKQRYCKCTLDSVVESHEPVMVVDGGMRCSDITEMAVEVKYTTDDGTHSLQRTEVHKVTCREQDR